MSSNRPRHSSFFCGHCQATDWEVIGRKCPAGKVPNRDRIIKRGGGGEFGGQLIDLGESTEKRN